MAGKPKRAAMIAELERLTRQEFGDEPASHLDYAELWVASGHTILELADVLSKRIFPTPDGQEPVDRIHREALSKYLNGLEKQRDEGTLTRARARASHALAEETLKLADGANEDNVQVVALQVRSRQWLTEKWNAAEFGQQKPGLTINIGTLMLEALRQPPPPVPAIAAAIVEEAQLLSGDVVETCEVEQ
jgi:hypothetical protein